MSNTFHPTPRRIAALTAALFGLAALAPAQAQEPQPACRTLSTAHTAALVELYTSEGCSSCPPADHWMSKLKPSAGVVPIAWHVGYWDSLGWKDRFVLPEAAPRQRQFTALEGGHTVYTPQVMVQGQSIDWRNAAKFTQRLKAVEQTTAPLRIAVARGMVLGGYVGAELMAQTRTPGVVGYLALLEDGLVSQVKAGENEGATLHHDRVVRQLVGPLALTREDGTTVKHVFALTLPPGADADRIHVVGWAEDGKGQVLQAVEANCPGL